MNGPGTWLGVTIMPANYSYEHKGQSSYPTIPQGGYSGAWLQYQNTGNVAWYDEISAWNAGRQPVRLGTDGPINRISTFNDAWRLGATRPADTFAAVYESDGTTLATNQHIVQPGQIARFEFSLKAKTWIGSGQRYEGFRPIVEGWGPMWSSGNYYSVIHVIQSDYSYGFKGQSPYPSIIQSNSSPAWLQYQNTGNVAWYDEISAWNAGRQPVRLGTDGPINRISTFNDAWRLGATRPADTFAAVYESDGTTLATNQHIVQPGQIAKFSFNLRAPSIKAPGFYPEAFRPIVEGRGPMNGPGTWLGVTIMPANYSYEHKGQSSYPTIPQGGYSGAWLQYQNTGNVAWYDEISAWNAGRQPVRLGTDGPINRISTFNDAWRLGATRPADTFAAVYESDGTTLATNQHIVQPGQIARFEFSLKAKTWIGSGQRYEGFRPIVEGWGPMWSSGNYYSVIHVIQSDYSYGFKGQSPYPSIIQSNSSPAWLQYQNTGNVAWYDEISAWNAGRQPVRLGTDGPINRISTFNDAWRLGATRPADTFAAVYESDGTTLATNQHIVQPGQIAKFSFNLRAPSIKAPGFYPEAFRPIVEGRGPMNGPGTWLGVTIP
jgi:hypothetical protein